MERKPFLLSEEMLFSDVLKKEAKFKLPSDLKAWDKAIVNQLHSTNPWLEPKTVKVALFATDKDKGAGLGGVVLDDAFVVPVVVRDFELMPLDMYFSGKTLKPLTKRGFLEEGSGDIFGKPREKGIGESSDTSLWGHNRMPYTGMGKYVQSSMVDADLVKEAVAKYFDVNQLSYVYNHKPNFIKVLNKAFKEHKEASAPDTDAEWHWKVSTYEKQDEESDSPVCFVRSGYKKVACITGNCVIYPGANTWEQQQFGIELNSDSPMWFVENNERDIFKGKYEGEITVKQAMLKDDEIDASQCCYIVPLPDGVGMVGPFLSLGKTEYGVEKIASCNGTSELIIAPNMDQAIHYVDNVIVLGKGAIRVKLGQSFTPATAEDNIVVKNAANLAVPGQILITTSKDVNGNLFASTDDIQVQPLKSFYRELEKEAGLTPRIKRYIEEKAKKNHPVALTKTQITKKKAGIKLKNFKLMHDKEKTIKSAAFIAPAEYTIFYPKSIRDGEVEFVKSAASFTNDDSEKTIDAVLNLNFITDTNVQQFLENVDDLEGARTKCAELLLASRLGLDVNGSPLKTAMLALDEAIRDLKQLRQASMIDAF